MTDTTQIHQIYFRPEQRAHLEPSFLPFDNSRSPAPEQMEYRVFHDAYQRGLTAGADYTGLVSWKFRHKAKITGRAFLDFIEANPGYDVYFINPFPAELVWTNVWLQGDHFHPGLLPFSQKIVDRIGYQIRLADLENLSNTAAYCNYWVGNQAFWDRYMAFTQPVYQYVLTRLSPAEKRFLWHRADREIDASHFPFLFERLFSTLLSTDPTIKALAYRYTADALRARYRPQVVELILANYDVEDRAFEQASRRLLRSVRGFDAARRTRSGPRRLVERVVQRAIDRTTRLLGDRRGRREPHP